MSGTESGAVTCLTSGLIVRSSAFRLFFFKGSTMDNEQIAGAIVFPVALVGVLANWTVALLLRRLPSLNNAFGRLTASQATGDAVHSTLFGFFYAPMLMFDITFLRSHSKHIGHALLVCYDISVYSHLFISLNRFCAIYFPLNYDRLFNHKNTTKIIIFTWAVAILSSFYFYQYGQ
ncbi:unnamed protein product [Caenorhabditis auriculariae]|uniref:G-protein coupled receptors family 1 profile domain-containing protein n=1 Tax=Caenorhabditis auriculariae TaxID=2777116 RepID=A0A8S1HGM6_9PELO|nr:unnamed protein product [Caenorhabditis auriculariae]